MSGGHYDYKYHYLNDLADEIANDLDSGSMYENTNTAEDRLWIREEVHDLIDQLRDCAKRAKELEWYMSGDTGIESYRKKIGERCHE